MGRTEVSRSINFGTNPMSLLDRLLRLPKPVQTQGQDLTPLTVARLPFLCLRNLPSEVIVSVLPTAAEGVITLSSFLDTYRPDARTEEMLYASFPPGVTFIRLIPLR